MWMRNQSTIGKQKNASPCIRTIGACIEESAASWMEMRIVETDGKRRQHLSGFQEQRRRGAVLWGFEVADGKRCPSMSSPHPRKGGLNRPASRMRDDHRWLPITNCGIAEPG